MSWLSPGTALPSACRDPVGISVTSITTWYVLDDDDDLIYKTTNAGSSWSTISLPSGASGTWQDITVVGQWMAVVTSSQMWLSINGGSTWTQSEGPPTGKSYAGVSMVDTSPYRVYCVTTDRRKYYYSSGWVFQETLTINVKSLSVLTNSGSTYAVVRDSTGSTDGFVYYTSNFASNLSLYPYTDLDSDVDAKGVSLGDSSPHWFVVGDAVGVSGVRVWEYDGNALQLPSIPDYSLSIYQSNNSHDIVLPEVSNSNKTGVTYDISSTLPSWMTFKASTRTLTVNTNGSRSAKSVTYRARKSSWVTATESFTVEVVDTTLHLVSIPNQTATVGQQFSMTLPHETSEESGVSYSLTGKPSWATYTAPTSSKDGSLSGTPTGTGTYSLRLSVSKTGFTGASRDFSITVGQAKTLKLPSIPKKSYTRGVAVNDLLPAATPSTGSPTITYSVTGLPAGLSFSSSTRRITGTPSVNTTGTTVTYKATATGYAEDSTTFRVVVTSSPTEQLVTTLDYSPSEQLVATLTYSPSESLVATLTYSPSESLVATLTYSPSESLVATLDLPVIARRVGSVRLPVRVGSVTVTLPAQRVGAIQMPVRIGEVFLGQRVGEVQMPVRVGEVQMPVRVGEVQMPVRVGSVFPVGVLRVGSVQLPVRVGSAFLGHRVGSVQLPIRVGSVTLGKRVGSVQLPARVGSVIITRQRVGSVWFPATVGSVGLPVRVGSVIVTRQRVGVVQMPVRVGEVQILGGSLTSATFELDDLAFSAVPEIGVSGVVEITDVVFDAPGDGVSFSAYAETIADEEAIFPGFRASDAPGARMDVLLWNRGRSDMSRSQLAVGGRIPQPVRDGNPQGNDQSCNSDFIRLAEDMYDFQCERGFNFYGNTSGGVAPGRLNVSLYNRPMPGSQYGKYRASLLGPNEEGASNTDPAWTPLYDFMQRGNLVTVTITFDGRSGGEVEQAVWIGVLESAETSTNSIDGVPLVDLSASGVLSLVSTASEFLPAVYHGDDSHLPDNNGVYSPITAVDIVRGMEGVEALPLHKDGLPFVLFRNAPHRPWQLYPGGVDSDPYHALIRVAHNDGAFIFESSSFPYVIYHSRTHGLHDPVMALTDGDTDVSDSLISDAYAIPVQSLANIEYRNPIGKQFNAFQAMVGRYVQDRYWSGDSGLTWYQVPSPHRAILNHTTVPYQEAPSLLVEANGEAGPFFAPAINPGTDLTTPNYQSQSTFDTGKVPWVGALSYQPDIVTGLDTLDGSPVHLHATQIKSSLAGVQFHIRNMTSRAAVFNLANFRALSVGFESGTLSRISKREDADDIAKTGLRRYNFTPVFAREADAESWFDAVEERYNVASSFIYADFFGFLDSQAAVEQMSALELGRTVLVRLDRGVRGGAILDRNPDTGEYQDRLYVVMSIEMSYTRPSRTTHIRLGLLSLGLIDRRSGRTEYRPYTRYVKPDYRWKVGDNIGQGSPVLGDGVKII